MNTAKGEPERGDWTSFSSEEIQQRRKASVDALAARDKRDFQQWYQAECDRMYWTRGQCCAGCDHWVSEAGMLGRCKAAGIVSGEEVLTLLLGRDGFCSLTPVPGLPYTKGDFHCGGFRDEFDWSTLDDGYLEHVCTMSFGALKPKPQTAIEENQL